MASGDHSITENIIVRLAEAISAKALERIALSYMGIESATLKNLKTEHREDIEGFNRDVIRKWCYMNPGPDQAKVRDRSKSRVIEPTGVVKLLLENRPEEFLLWRKYF